MGLVSGDPMIRWTTKRFIKRKLHIESPEKIWVSFKNSIFCYHDFNLFAWYMMCPGFLQMFFGLIHLVRKHVNFILYLVCKHISNTFYITVIIFNFKLNSYVWKKLNWIHFVFYIIFIIFILFLLRSLKTFMDRWVF
jgi:hypothetical protein